MGYGDNIRVVVEQLPGGSKKILDSCKSMLPASAKFTTNETITSLGPLTGTGTHFIAVIPAPDASRLECVLFFPNNKINGYYIFTMLGGPTDPEFESDIAHIVASMHKEP